ncbi:hypothetical protein PGT21_005584 [Puccinia graminis f. sp. tritici]|uniref:Chromosome segregation in meiosis protein n=1 Tax=Puccinia graminis f. sp. tritici TaxID=56615 RepID=A0A5B0MN01_PUCGR|nr:hypothetical protein PGT21_005584 [Puccinia graminis f. sp. tritici]
MDEQEDSVSTSRRQQPRFLGDDAMDEETATNLPESLDRFFAGLEGEDQDEALPEMLDHAAIEASLAAKKVEALDPFALVSGEQAVKKKTARRPTVKLDEDRLLDPKLGIPHLISLSKNFKPSGKGNEKEDLKRLLKLYRLWTHSMYPKGSFKDTIETIGKLCHKRKMRNAMRGWREESTGGTKPAKKKAKLDGSTEVEPGLEDEAGRGTGETRPVDAAGASGGSLGTEPEMVSRVPDGMPLFRPAEEEEEEEDEFFPGDDQLCGFLDTIDSAAKPPVEESPVIDQEQEQEEEDEFAEEEALLREADLADASLQKSSSLPMAGSGPSAPREEPGHDWDDLYQ